jgi:hypothetical protein
MVKVKNNVDKAVRQGRLRLVYATSLPKVDNVSLYEIVYPAAPPPPVPPATPPAP